MADTEFDELLEQLDSEDAKVRRKAARQLGELGNTNAIAQLANAYNNDSDPGVKRAAEDALRRFRRMEQQVQSGEEIDIGGGGGISSGLNEILGKARLVLLVTFVVTLVINGALVVIQSLPPPPTLTPTMAVASSRNVLIDTFRKRIDQTREEARIMRPIFADFQGRGFQVIADRKEQCQKLATSTLNKGELSVIDSATFPDLPAANNMINIATIKVYDLRTRLVGQICTAKTPKEYADVMKGDFTADKLVQKVDEVLNTDLANAERKLKDVIDRPAPTITPTPTPSNTPTVAPTFTATASPTAGPTTPAPAGTRAANAPTTAPGAGTAAATAAATGGAPAATITLTDLGLSKIPSYKYQLTSEYTITATQGNRAARGNMRVIASRQASPLMTQYDITLTEGTGATFYKTLGAYYIAGNSQYILTNDVLYETGSVLTAQRVTGRCRASKSTPEIMARLKDPASEYLDLGNATVTLTLKEGPSASINGMKVTRYTAETFAGDNKEFVQNFEVALAADGSVVQMIGTIALNPKLDAAAKTKVGISAFKLTMNYELRERDVLQNIGKPAVCEGVSVK